MTKVAALSKPCLDSAKKALRQIQTNWNIALTIVTIHLCRSLQKTQSSRPRNKLAAKGAKIKPNPLAVLSGLSSYTAQKGSLNEDIDCLEIDLSRT